MCLKPKLKASLILKRRKIKNDRVVCGWGWGWGDVDNYQINDLIFLGAPHQFSATYEHLPLSQLTSRFCSSLLLEQYNLLKLQFWTWAISHYIVMLLMLHNFLKINALTGNNKKIFKSINIFSIIICNIYFHLMSNYTCNICSGVLSSLSDKILWAVILNIVQLTIRENICYYFAQLILIISPSRMLCTSFVIV